MLLDQKRHIPNSEDVALWMANTLCSLADAVIATNAQGQVIFMNGAAEELTRVPLERAINMLASEILHVEENTAAGSERVYPLRDAFLDERTIRSQQPCTFFPKNRKTTVSVDFTASPLQNESGECVGAVIVVRPAPRANSTPRILLSTSSEKYSRAN